MLTIFRRHSRSCPGRNRGREWRKCHCPINLEGYLGEQYIRQSLSMRSWDPAQARVRELQASVLFPTAEKPAPVEIETSALAKNDPVTFHWSDPLQERRFKQ